MADEAHDLGEVWGKVENLETNFDKLGKQVGEGFKALGDSIKDSHEKTDKRITDLARDTATRFNETNTEWRQNSTQRVATSLQVIGYLLTGLIGFGTIAIGAAGMGFTFYTLTRAPINDAFARQDAVNKGFSDDIKAVSAAISALSDSSRDRLDKKLADYVPRQEVEKSIGELKANQVSQGIEIQQISKAAEVSRTDRIAIHETLTRLEAMVSAISTELRTNYVPRPENENRWGDAITRLTTIANALAELRKNVNDGNGVGDRMNRLQSSIDELRSRFLITPPTPFANQSPPPGK